MNPVGFSFEFIPNELPEPKGRFAKYEGKEVNFQIAVAYYLRSIGADFYHVANERQTAMKQRRNGTWYSPEGNKLKAEGVRPGFADNIIFDHRRGYIGFIIELKTGYNKPTTEQLAFIEARKKQGWFTLISWSLDEVVFYVDWYFGIKTAAQLLR